MIKVEIKTIWQGKIGVRDKYIRQARERKEDICFVKGRDIMIVPFAKLDEAIVGKSAFPVEDKYSKESHYLLYFNWKPTTLQKRLF